MTTSLVKREKMLKVIVKSGKETFDTYLHPVSNYNALKEQIASKSHIEVAPYTFVSWYKVEIKPYDLRKGTVEDQIGDLPFKEQLGVRRIYEERRAKQLPCRLSIASLLKIYQIKQDEAT